jgi:hypothetical protein
MAKLVNLITSIPSGVPSVDKFMSVFSKIGQGVDAFATMIINSQNSIQNDLSGYITKMTDEITKLAVANATYVTNSAIGKDVTGMPSAESLTRSLNTGIQDELRRIMEKMSGSILRPLQLPAPVPSGPIVNPSGGGFKRAKTLKNISVIHRTKTHRRSAVVAKV